jgi:hypothetical protein
MTTFFGVVVSLCRCSVDTATLVLGYDQHAIVYSNCLRLTAVQLQPKFSNLSKLCFYYAGQDSSVGIETCYGIDNPGIGSRWGRDFLHPSWPDVWPTQPPVRWVPGLFLGGKAAGAWRWPPTDIYRRSWRKSRGTTFLPLWGFMAPYTVNFVLFTFSDILCIWNASTLGHDMTWHDMTSDTS